MCKLEDIWEGACEVNKNISEVNYELLVPERRSKKMVVHVIIGVRAGSRIEQKC